MPSAELKSSPLLFVPIDSAPTSLNTKGPIESVPTALRKKRMPAYRSEIVPIFV